MKFFRLLALIGSATALGSIGFGQVVTVTGVPSSQSESFVAGDPAGTTTSTITFATSGNFSYNFASTAGSDTLSVIWQAAQGTNFQIIVPNTLTTAYLELSFQGGSGWGTTPWLDASPTVTFGNLSGSLSSPTAEIKLSSDGTGFLASYSAALAAGSTYSFNSVTIATTVPNTFTADFSSGGGVSVGSFYLRGSGTGSVLSDPGIWVSSVPEPSTWALGGTMLSAGLFTLWRRRRVSAAA